MSSVYINFEKHINILKFPCYYRAQGIIVSVTAGICNTYRYITIKYILN